MAAHDDDAQSLFTRPSERNELFRKFIDFHAALTLTERRVRGKSVLNAFTEPDGLTILHGQLSAADVAAQTFQVFSNAQLVQAIGPEDGTGRNVVAITRKGECVAAGEFEGYLTQIAWQPQQQAIGLPEIKHVAKTFVRFIGAVPNDEATEKEKNNRVRSSNASALGPVSPTTSSHTYSAGDGDDDEYVAPNTENNAPGRDPLAGVSNFVVPPGVPLKERTLQNKTYTHTFTGSDAVAHLLTHTTCVTVAEALQVANLFVSKGWLQFLEDTATSNPNSSGSVFKDSSKVIYRVTPVGARFAGWPDSRAPTIRDNKEHTSFLKGGLKGRLRKMAGLTASAGSSATSSGGEEGSLISKENLNKFDDFVRKSSEMLNADRPEGSGGSRQGSAQFDQQGGAQQFAGSKESTRRSTLTAAGQGFGQDVLGALGVGSAAAQANSAGTGRRKRSATIGTETPGSRSRQSSAQPPSFTASPLQQQGSQQDAQRPGSGITRTAPSSSAISQMASGTTTTTGAPWETGKENNAQRLTTILHIPALRSAFYAYLGTLFCQENYDFLVDVERFRLCYDTASTSLKTLDPHDLLNPDTKGIADNVQKSCQGNAQKLNETMFAHALVLYLKYVAKTSPFELNIPSKVQKVLTATLSPSQTYFNTITTALDLSVPQPIDPTGSAFKAMVQNLPASFGTQVAETTAAAPENVGSWMYSAAESHIFQMVAGDSVPKFTKTESYKSLMGKAYEDGTLSRIQLSLAGQPGISAGAGMASVRRSSATVAAEPPKRASIATGATYIYSAGGQGGDKFVPREGSEAAQQQSEGGAGKPAGIQPTPATLEGQ